MMYDDIDDNIIMDDKPIICTSICIEKEVSKTSEPAGPAIHRHRAWMQLHSHRLFGPSWNPCKVQLDAGYRSSDADGMGSSDLKNHRNHMEPQ